jgi:hypothetical protein
MKKLHLIAQLPDQSFVFYISFNDNEKDPYSGYFCQSLKHDATIAELRPIALNEIKCADNWLSDIDKAMLNAMQLNILGGEKALLETVKGCAYDIRLHGENCYAYHLEKACIVQHLKLKSTHPERLLQSILFWTSGQPFLTQKLCNLVIKSPVEITLENISKILQRFAGKGPKDRFEACNFSSSCGSAPSFP